MSHSSQKLFCTLIFAILAVNPYLLQSTEYSLTDTARLPNTSFPLNYTIHLTTNVHLGDLSYAGNCNITVKVIKATDRLVMHANDLSIDKIFMSDVRNERPKERLRFNILNESLILERANLNATRFENGQILRIEIQFTGTIYEDQNIGFQRGKSTDHNGQEVIVAYTYFQPNGARLTFPCYDEPAYKAKFTLRLTHGSNLTAISNMPQDGELIKDSSGASGMVTTKFLQTENMSSYLFAFVLTNFEYLSYQQKSEDLPKRIFRPNGIENDTWNIFAHTDWALKTMKEVFDVTYNFPKFDFVILNLNDGGMENWALNYLSFGENTYQAGQCFRDTFEYTLLIFHEFIHQWFGNLVTMEWWTHLWINEGFATYYAYVLADLRTPEDRGLDRLRASVCLSQLMWSMEGVMSTYTETVGENLFNETSYGKAACVIQMFEHAFAQKAFRHGVSKYLKANLHSIVFEDDLFDSLQLELLEQHNSTGRTWNYSAHEIMKSWTHSASFPTISVKRDYSEANSNKVKIQQDSVSGEKFWVPLTFATTTSPDFETTKADYLFKPIGHEVEIDLGALNMTLGPNDWLIANKNAIGYYKVKYDDENLRRLIEALNANRQSISPLNRAALYANIADVELQPDGDIYLSNVTVLDLELIASLKNEDDPIVWLTAANRIRFLPIYNRHRFELLRTYLKLIIEPQYERFQRKSRTGLSPIENLLLKELQALARDLNLKTALTDQNLTESYLKSLLESRVTAEDDLKLHFNSRTCRTSKSLSVANFNSLLEYFEYFEDDCERWMGLQCTQREETFLQYLEVFDYTWGGEHGTCNCKLINILTFLQMDFVDAWSKAWPKIIESFKSFMLSNKTNCTTKMLKQFKETFSDFHPKNLIKFQDGFRSFAEFNDFYEKQIIEEKAQDEATKWLNEHLR